MHNTSVFVILLTLTQMAYGEVIINMAAWQSCDGLLSRVVREAIKDSKNIPDSFPLSTNRIHSLMLTVMEAANEAGRRGDAPFGVLLVDFNGNIILRAQNNTNTTENPIGHAETNLITLAGQLGFTKKDFSQLVLVSNAESCSMCSSAAIKSGIRYFVFGSPPEDTLDPYIRPKDVADKSANPIVIVQRVMSAENSALIRNARKKAY